MSNLNSREKYILDMVQKADEEDSGEKSTSILIQRTTQYLASVTPRVPYLEVKRMVLRYLLKKRFQELSDVKKGESDGGSEDRAQDPGQEQ